MNFLFMASFWDNIKSWFEGTLGAVLSIIPKTFYQLLTPFYGIMDLLQLLVRKLAGLETIYGINSEKYTGDLVLYFINLIFSGESNVLRNIFISLIVLGAVMLVITTFIAVLRSEYTATDSKSASKGKIIVNALKAIASFAIVPVVCFFGMFLANVILNAVDMATSVADTNESITTDLVVERDSEGNPTKTETVSVFKKNKSGTLYNYSILGVKIASKNAPISGLLFKSAAYGANRARKNDQFYNTMMNNDGVSAKVFNLKKGTTDTIKEYNCELMDSAFANTYQLRESVMLDTEPFKTSHMFPFNGTIAGSIADTALSSIPLEYFDKNNVSWVWYYYDLWAYDYVIAIGASIMILTILFSMVFGLIKRLYELIVLFLISAPLASLMPLDGGSALKKWREKFVSKAIGTYGPIAGLNLFFILLGLISRIQLVGHPVADKLVNVLLTIAGLTMVKDISTLISELAGGDDTLKAGQDKAKEAGAVAKKIGVAAAAVAGGGAFVVGKTAFAGRAAVKGAGKGLKNLKKEYGQVKADKAYGRSINEMAGDIKDEDVSKSEIGVEAIKHNMKKGNYNSVKNDTDIDIWKDYADKYNVKKFKSGNDVWNKMTDNEREEVATKIAKRDYSKLSSSEKDQLHNEIINNTPEKEKKEIMQNAKVSRAKDQLNNMSEEDRESFIESHKGSARKNSKIRKMAEEAAGGAEKYKNLSDKEKAEKRSDAKNKYEIKKAELTAKALDPLKKEFADLGKRLFSFTGTMYDQAKGAFSEGSKDTLGGMFGAFMGKTRKENAIEDRKSVV